MKNQSIHALVTGGLMSLLVLGISACSSEEDGYASATEDGAGAAVDAVEEAEPLLTEEELSSQAETEITKENADEAFEDLKREIESDG